MAPTAHGSTRPIPAYYSCIAGVGNNNSNCTIDGKKKMIMMMIITALELAAFAIEIKKRFAVAHDLVSKHNLLVTHLRKVTQRPIRSCRIRRRFFTDKAHVAAATHCKNVRIFRGEFSVILTGPVP